MRGRGLWARDRRSRRRARVAREEDRTLWRAIADPTRRRILDLLVDGDAKAGDLAKPFDMTLPAISQHLAVLREAGLVAETRIGRERWYRLDADPLRDLARWIAHYERLWTDKLDALGRILDEEKD